MAYSYVSGSVITGYIERSSSVVENYTWLGCGHHKHAEKPIIVGSLDLSHYAMN